MGVESVRIFPATLLPKTQVKRYENGMFPGKLV